MFSVLLVGSRFAVGLPLKRDIGNFDEFAVINMKALRMDFCFLIETIFVL